MTYLHFGTSSLTDGGVVREGISTWLFKRHQTKTSSGSRGSSYERRILRPTLKNLTKNVCVLVFFLCFIELFTYNYIFVIKSWYYNTQAVKLEIQSEAVLFQFPDFGIQRKQMFCISFYSSARYTFLKRVKKWT